MSSEEFKRWARFGVDQDGIKYIPVGGTCLIDYLISRKGDSLLVGKVNGKDQAEYWKKEAIYLQRPNIWVGKWFIPCGFLHFGQTPQDRAKVLVKDMLNASAKSIKLSKVVSYTEDSSYYPGYHHWHVDFVYELEELKLGKTPVWWDSLEYVPIKDLTPEKIGMAGEMVLEKLNSD
jgi:ADP-ribose pyrophosphatase YjhB (NUDIX family)